jgi:hypothetical protein
VELTVVVVVVMFEQLDLGVQWECGTEEQAVRVALQSGVAAVAAQVALWLACEAAGGELRAKGGFIAHQVRGAQGQRHGRGVCKGRQIEESNRETMSGGVSV